MTQPADFARHLEGDNRRDWTVWLIFADCLADHDLWEEAEELRQAVLAERPPDQLVTENWYILLLPFSGKAVYLPRHPSYDD